MSKNSDKKGLGVPRPKKAGSGSTLQSSPKKAKDLRSDPSRKKLPFSRGDIVRWTMLYIQHKKNVVVWNCYRHEGCGSGFAVDVRGPYAKQPPPSFLCGWDSAHFALVHRPAKGIAAAPRSAKREEYSVKPGAQHSPKPNKKVI